MDDSCCGRAQLKVALGSRECGLTMLNAEPSHKQMACMDDGEAREPALGRLDCCVGSASAPPRDAWNARLYYHTSARYDLS